MARKPYKRKPPAQPKLPSLEELVQKNLATLQKEVNRIEERLARHDSAGAELHRIQHSPEFSANRDKYQTECRAVFEHNKELRKAVAAIHETEKANRLSQTSFGYRLSTWFSAKPRTLSSCFLDSESVTRIVREAPRSTLDRLEGVTTVAQLARLVAAGEVSFEFAVAWVTRAKQEGRLASLAADTIEICRKRRRRSAGQPKELTIDADLSESANRQILALESRIRDCPTLPDPRENLPLISYHDLPKIHAKLARYKEAVSLRQTIKREGHAEELRQEIVDKITKQRRRKEAQQMRRILSVQLTVIPHCPYCLGELGDNAVIDHIYPVSRGGLSKDANLVIVCWQCNSDKSDKTLFEFIRQKCLDLHTVEETMKKLGKSF